MIEFKSCQFNAGTTAQQTYQVPRGRRAVVVAATFLNKGGATSNLTVHFVKNGEGAIDNNKVINVRPMESNETWLGYPVIGHVLQEQDQLFVQASTNGDINLTLSVKEIF